MKFATTEELTAKGFKPFGKLNFLHAGYPGLIFQRVETAADCAAIGGAMVLYPNGDCKLMFGADVGYHLYKDGDQFPRERAIPLHAKVQSRKGPSSGTFIAPGKAVAQFYASLECTGTDWLDLFTGEGLLIGFQSRVPRGLLFKRATEYLNPTGQWRWTAAENTEEEPNAAYISTYAGGPINTTYPPGTKIAVLSSENSGGNRVGLGYSKGWNGQIHPAVMIDVRAFIEAAREKWLKTLDSDVESAVRKAWTKALESVPSGSIPFAIPLSAKDNNGKLGLTSLLPAFKTKNANVLGYHAIQWVPDARQNDGVFFPESIQSEGCSTVSEYGIFRAGEQATLPMPMKHGETNNPNHALDVISQCGEMNDMDFFRVPDINVVDADGNTIFGSATLFAALSPLVKPKGPKVDVLFEDLMNGHEAARANGFRGNKINAQATNEEDPMALEKLASGGSETTGIIAFQKSESRCLEPFSRALAEFGATLFALVDDGYEGDPVLPDDGDVGVDVGERGSYTFPVPGGTLPQMRAFERNLVKLGVADGESQMNDVRNRVAGRSLVYVDGLNKAQGVSGLNWAQVDTSPEGVITHVYALVQNPVKVTKPTKFYFTGDEGSKGDGYIATLEPGSEYQFLLSPTRLMKDGVEQPLTRYGKARFQGAYVGYEVDPEALPESLKVVGFMNTEVATTYDGVISDPVAYMSKIKLSSRTLTGDLPTDWGFDPFDGIA